MGIPWLGQPIPFVLYPRSIRDDHNTADGGRPSRIDLMMDADGPASTGPMRDRKAEEDYSRQCKVFRATAETRQGGSGLYHHDKE